MSIFSAKNKIPPSERLIEVEFHQDNNQYQSRINLKKLELSDENKERLFSQINALKPHIIDGVKNTAIANLYSVRFPEGLPKVLTKLNQGGYMSFVRDKGKIVGTASLVQASAGSIAALNIFTAISVITGQYFLANINSQLSNINDKLDIIQASLDNDKKARLKSDEERIQDIIDGKRNPNEIEAYEKDADELMKYYFYELESAYEKNKKKIKDDTFYRTLSMCVLLQRSMLVLVQFRLLEALFGQRYPNTDRNEIEDIINSSYSKINDICREMKGSLETKIKTKKITGYLNTLSDFGIDTLMEEQDKLKKNIIQAIEFTVSKEILIDSKKRKRITLRTYPTGV